MSITRNCATPSFRTAILALRPAALLTEILSPFHLLSRWPILIAWVIVLAIFYSRARALPVPAWSDCKWYLPTALVTLPVAIAAVLVSAE